ncbi:hypothetical protein EMCRGX_G007020 [Ephydatia muelleri]
MLLTAMLMLVTADGKGIGDSGPRLLQGLLRASKITAALVDNCSSFRAIHTTCAMFSSSAMEDHYDLDTGKGYRADGTGKDARITHLQQRLEAQAIQLKELAATNEILRREKATLEDKLEQETRAVKASLEALAKPQVQEPDDGARNSPQPQPSKLRKEAIGTPTSFKHVEHAGAGEGLKFSEMPDAGVAVAKKGEVNSSIRQAMQRGERPVIGPPTMFTHVEHIGAKLQTRMEDLPNAGPQTTHRGSAGACGDAQPSPSRNKNGRSQPLVKKEHLTKLDIGPPTSFEHVSSQSMPNLDSMMQFQRS